MKSSYKILGVFFFVLSPLIVLSCHEYEEHDFNYDERTGRGPSRWGTLKQKWEKCSTGRKQSPINIETIEIRRDLGVLRRNYSSALAVLKNETQVVEVVWKGNAGRININGTNYNVDNVHWHSSSEHTFNGTRYDLELHLVHRTAQDEIAVVAILYRFGPPDPFLSMLLPSIRRLEAGEREVDVGSINPESIGFTTTSSSSYYRYMGSLTTPPCTQGVIWTVFTQVRMVSVQQVEALRNVLPPQNKNNSRPTQPLNGRPVFQYDYMTRPYVPARNN